MKFLEHPFFGNGLCYESFSNMRSHNFILQILYENGLVGFCGLLLFLYDTLFLIKHNKKKNKYFYAFSIMFPFILINALVEETFFSHVIVLLGLVFIIAQKKDKIQGDKLYV